MSRFDYIKYDQASITKQEELKKLFQQVEACVERNIDNGRAKSLILTYLEIAYMWTGKAIRDNQIERDSKTENAPERSNQ